MKLAIYQTDIGFDPYKGLKRKPADELFGNNEKILSGNREI